MDKEDLDMGFDWTMEEILCNVSATLPDFPTNVWQQVNEPNVHDMVGTVVATPNMAHNTEEVNSSSMGGNPPQLSVNDSYQLPLLSPNTSAPLLDPDAESNCYIPSMVGLISEGVGSSVQAQDITIPMNCNNQYPLMQNNNLPLRPELGQVNENNTSNQLLVSNMLANQNFNEFNALFSSYPPFFKQNHVQAGTWSWTTNGHFMTNQTSPVFALNNRGINPPSAWNSPRAQTSVPGLSMLNQNDRSTFDSYGSYSTLLPNPRGQREPPRRGRPRKHFEPGQTSLPPYKRRKRGNPGKTPSSGGNNTSDGVVIREDQNPRNPSSDATASREQVNAMYDPAFERAGVPIDPILRLFNANSEKPAEEGRENPNWKSYAPGILWSS
ncbi:hypothetical protein AAZX31_04G103300 [Glycine max]